MGIMEVVVLHVATVLIVAEVATILNLGGLGRFG